MMKTLPKTMALFCGVLCLASLPLSSQDTDSASPESPEAKNAASSFAGKWAWRTRAQSVESTLTLKPDGTGLSGTYRGSWGPERNIEEVAIDGDKLSFTITNTWRDRSFTTRFEGELEGDSAITGSIEMEGGDQSRSIDWSAYRFPSVDPTGLWKWSSEGRDGSSRENWVKFALDKGALSGVYMTERGRVPIGDAKVSDDRISFIVERGFGRRTFTTRYEGRMGGKGIEGAVVSVRDDEETRRDWAAVRETPKIDPAGVWKWTTTRREGESFDNEITLAVADGKLTGTYASRDDESAIEEGKVDGDRVDFKITRETDRGEFTMRFRGRIDEDRLTGTIASGRENGTWRRRWDATRVLPAADPSGVWTWETRWRRDGEPVASELTLALADGKLTGNYEGSLGEFAISNGKFDHNRVEFTVRQERDGRAFASHFRGTVRGDVVRGDIRFGDDAGDDDDAWAWKWEAARESHTDPTGAWVVEITSESGDVSELRMQIKSEGNSLTGTVGAEDWEVAIEDAALKGNTLTFHTKSAREGSGTVFRSTATIDGDTMTGSSVFERDGETTKLAWRAKRR